jgi:hypothetical protein
VHRRVWSRTTYRSGADEDLVRSVVSKGPQYVAGGFVYHDYSAYLCGKISRRADSNRLPLLQLRVIIHVLQRIALACTYRIFSGFSFLGLAPRCTVLRSRWCQSGVNITLVSTLD